jgi:AcrR family transcriptional regulator
MVLSEAIAPDILDAVVRLAADRGVPIAALSVDEIAAALGMSRMTLYRRIGSRKALHAALRAGGHDLGEVPGAAERALAAASALIREGGVAALTLEGVAARAGCALPTIYARFGGRTGLLMAVFERHSPILRVKDALVDVEPGDEAAFRRVVSSAYAVIYDTFTSEQAMLRALLVEALRDPAGEVGQFVSTRYLPGVMTHIMPWVARHIARGIIRPLPLVLVGQQFAAPLVMHIATRSLVAASGVFELPDPGTVCDAMAAMFCRAVAADPLRDPEPVPQEAP